jgi:hypothetical protein
MTVCSRHSSSSSSSGGGGGGGRCLFLQSEAARTAVAQVPVLLLQQSLGPHQQHQVWSRHDRSLHSLQLSRPQNSQHQTEHHNR